MHRCVVGADTASGHIHMAGWHLVEHRHVEVPIQRHGQGARYGGGGHDQEVRVVVLCLFPKLNPLVHPETVLFVDDGDAEPGELDTFLDERMGPDDEVDVAPGNEREEIGAAVL